MEQGFIKCSFKQFDNFNNQIILIFKYSLSIPLNNLEDRLNNMNFPEIQNTIVDDNKMWRQEREMTAMHSYILLIRK